MATPITPHTRVYLLKCPLEMDNNHQLNFASRTAQYNYFNSLPKIELENFSYQRQDGVVRVDMHIDDLYEYNYIMYQNDNYTDKWFYCFITGMQYINDRCTYISIKTDVFQTWQFDLTFRKCFVEREHVNDDTIGANTVPESFELGEYICNFRDERKFAELGSNSHRLMLAFQVTKADLGNGNVIPSNTKQVYGGLPQGCYIFGIPLDDDHIGVLHTVIGFFDASGFGESIVSIFVSAEDLNPWTQKAGQGIFNTNDFYVPSESWSAWGSATPSEITQPLLFENYRPTNNKLYTAPYNYFHISNHLGSDVSFAYEDFTGTPKFALTGVFSQGCCAKFIPMNSKKASVNYEQNNFDEGIIGGKLPVISWMSDYYLNWEAVNAKNVEIQTALSTIDLGTGIFGSMMGGIMGVYDKLNHETAGYLNASESSSGVTGFASNIANTLQQVKQAKMTPPQAKGDTSAGDLAFSMNKYSFEWFCMSIKAEYAKKIDDYWSAYGYKVNSYKVPNITGRLNWNFVKCIDVNILADIPQTDLSEIKGMFNNGVTIWHNPNTFLDYSQDNNIV